jgi:hypothetical protein
MSRMTTNQRNGQEVNVREWNRQQIQLNFNVLLLAKKQTVITHTLEAVQISYGREG